MTSAEKQAYVDALNQLWDEGVIQQFTQFHEAEAPDIHRSEAFLPWHREFTIRFERELQRVNPDLSIPYWDWRTDRSRTPEWDQADFLGPFDDSWSLNRNLGQKERYYPLPTTEQIDQALALPNFSTGGFTGRGFGGGSASGHMGDVETYHNNVHVWVNGAMLTMASPRDPIFYLHHSMIDKIWKDWAGVTSFTINALSTWPEIDPHSLIDSRDLKVWYAENGLVTLDQYAVSGEERYRYTGSITAQDFVVPSGTTCTFEAGAEVVLGPGFNAEAGSFFTASAGGAASASMSVGPSGTEAATRDALQSGSLDAARPGAGMKAASQEAAAGGLAREAPSEHRLGRNYPNPFNPSTTIEYALKESASVTLKVFNLLGQEVITLVAARQPAGHHTVDWDGRDGAGRSVGSGTYVYQMKASDYVQSRTMVLVK